LLVLLKDLWTGDLPLGGESGVGRGRLRGLSATLEHTQDGATTAWSIEPDGEKLKVSVDPSAEDEWQSLERFARVLNLHLAGR
jgi:hypothetical protein